MYASYYKLGAARNGHASVDVKMPNNEKLLSLGKELNWNRKVTATLTSAYIQEATSYINPLKMANEQLQPALFCLYGLLLAYT